MNTAPTTYAIRVDGHLDDRWSAWLGDLEIARNDDGTTTLTVSNADQAQLHGVLASLRDIGAVITELRTSDALLQPDGRCDLRSTSVGLPDPVGRNDRPKARKSESGSELERRLRPPKRG